MGQDFLRRKNKRHGRRREAHFARAVAQGAVFHRLATKRKVTLPCTFASDSQPGALLWGSVGKNGTNNLELRQGSKLVAQVPVTLLPEKFKRLRPNRLLVAQVDSLDVDLATGRLTLVDAAGLGAEDVTR